MSREVSVGGVLITTGRDAEGVTPTIVKTGPRGRVARLRPLMVVSGILFFK